MANRYLRFVPVADHHAFAGHAAAVAAASASFTVLPQPDPPLTFRDSAVFLMQLAAEIEHALLVQYLYAAFSLDRSAPGVPNTAFGNIFNTAKEEMGHLLTVQNVLLALGSSASLFRENMPIDTDFYPFPFMLEPVSRSSLAKYVLAEMPDGGLDAQKLAQVKADAGVSDSVMVNQVSHLYRAIVEFLEQASDGIFDSSLQTLQGDPTDWRASSVTVTRDAVTQRPIDVGPGVFVTPIATRAEALDALRIIALQGEGAAGAEGPASHFRRFLAIYDAAVTAPGPIALSVATHPNTSVHPDPVERGGAITHPVSRLWAQLSNSRYRMLLAYLGHYLATDRGTNGRTDLAEFAFEEMGNIARLSAHLVTLDRTTMAADGKAGPPFEMPYTLLQPIKPVSRWRMQLDLIGDSSLLKDRIVAQQGDPGHVLDDLSDDAARTAMIEGFIASP
jgi:hypothetical protein